MFKSMDNWLNGVSSSAEQFTCFSLSESPVNTDITDTWSSSSILDTSFTMVDFKLTSRNAFYKVP